MSESTALKWLLLRANCCLVKLYSCAVSVVKVGNVQDRAATSCVQREISVFMAMNEPWGQIDVSHLCLSVSFKELTLQRLKSSILVLFCWSLFQRKLCILG